MALSEEQRSLLQLLLQGQSYEDIGSLLGVGPDEVRSRARAALTEMAGADPDAQVAISDYLLGKADPIGRADAVRHLQNDPAAHDTAQRLISQLRLLAPQADLPELPDSRGGRRAAPPPPAAPAPGAPTPGSPAGGPPLGAPQPSPASGESLAQRMTGSLGGSGNQSKVLIGIGALALVIAVVIAVVLLGGDDGDDGDSTDTTASAGDDLTIVQLAPISGDSGASGQATFAQAQDQPLLQLNLSGLPPAGKGQTYIIWLYNSASVAFPVARQQVGEDGNLTGAAAIPGQIAPLFGCVDVSLASNKETQDALKAAVDQQTVPSHSGETVLRGQIPTEPGTEAPSGADSQCEPPASAEQPQGGAGAGAGQGGAGAGNGGGAAQQSP
jgi:hypothetical protein